VDDSRGERRYERRVRLGESAALLVVSEDALRAQVKRRALRSEKETAEGCT
jgi:hypothetical protein